MSLVDVLTPEHTEELKHGLFIQRRKKGYRQIEPLVWNGKFRWKAQLKTVFCLRTFITIAIILFIVWAYQHDIKAYKDFYYSVNNDPIGYCDGVSKALISGECTEIYEQSGLCNREISNISDFNWTVIKRE